MEYQGPLYFRSPLFQRRNNSICAKIETHYLIEQICDERIFFWKSFVYFLL